MGIGNRLKEIRSQVERSRNLFFELVVLNSKLPARVWLPLYAHSYTHLVVRVAYAEGCILNSKDRAPYCAFCEVVEVPDVYSYQLPAREREAGAETKRINGKVCLLLQLHQWQASYCLDCSSSRRSLCLGDE